jgi:hypothetical protein
LPARIVSPLSASLRPAVIFTTVAATILIIITLNMIIVTSTDIITTVVIIIVIRNCSCHGTTGTHSANRNP